MADVPAGVMMATIVIELLIVLGAAAGYFILGKTAQNMLIGMLAAGVAGIILLRFLIAGFGG